jgi:hypothetical protein
VGQQGYGQARREEPAVVESWGATRLYERVGMRVVNRWDLWERSGGSP